jgi:hypothetical protein
LALALLPVGSWPVAAQTIPEPADHVLVSEVQAAGESPNDEFIELYNPLDTPIQMQGWRVERAPATISSEASWLPIFTFPDYELEPHTYYLLCRQLSTNAPAPLFLGCNESFIPGMTVSGGHVRLVRSDETTPETEDIIVVDQLGWGSANQPEGFGAPALAGHKSLQRCMTEEHLLRDSDDNSADFFLDLVSDPANDPPTCSQEEPDPEPEPTPSPDPPITYATLLINEILPDPASPKTDADDEFIELYNPGSVPVSLKNYVLQTGSSLQYRYTIPTTTIPAKGYKVFYARTSRATLSNSGSRVQLLAPDGSISATLVSYGDSKEGESWARLGSKYTWTDRTTPGGANQSHSPEVKKIVSSATAANTTTPKSYARVTLSEVFPDPDSPQKDADDEFVEIYNPNSFTVNLEGYKIKTGSSLKTNETLEGITIRPKSYVAVFNRDANLSLTNAGGRVLLLDPNDKELSRTDAWSKAEVGQSWALVGGKWQWTGRPTPAAGNIAQSVPSTSLTSRAGDPGLNSPLSGVLGNLTQPAALPTSSKPNWRLIAGVGTAVGLYMAYESRHDVRNWLYRWQRHRQIGHGGK